MGGWVVCVLCSLVIISPGVRCFVYCGIALVCVNFNVCYVMGLPVVCECVISWLYIPCVLNDLSDNVLTIRIMTVWIQLSSSICISFLYLGPSVPGLVTAIQVNVYTGNTLSRLSFQN